MTDRLVPLAVPAGLDAAVVPAIRAALDGTGPALAPHAADEPPPDLPADAELPEGLALAVGTSGSTGRPKRALLTAAALRVSAAATHERLGGSGQWLLAMPAHHIAGLQVLIRSVLAGRDPVVLDRTAHFSAASFAAATDRLVPAGRHYTAVVPTQLARLLADEVGRRALLRYDGVLAGGAATPAVLLERAADAGVRVLTTYGMSETAGGCFYDGTPLSGARVRFDETGRVSLGGPMVAHGYLGEPALTAASFATDGGTRWFRTDDLGHLEAAGQLRVEGRIDDVINTGGLKVPPRLVEDALTRHLPQVLEAVVVGTPDPEWGQAVSAAVVCTDGRDVTVSDVRAALRGILPDHALPRRVARWAAIPRRGPGKPDRQAIRARSVWQDGV
ncbi:MAG TPA: o-succinylbenzoate--CoA ligase [Segeticoccus sp.]|uniref:o-succinylbenzoate--CoA ligase n=1 Tax=Segeticoccus sp. TaxID=2706531 RepID=UPI002D80EFEF|nr:o-succinylbenzoate--CoA ligase [Segeticoccus sp.]HET8601077.1 o-succinylbenzoate--CoA ligase [Segeticoccus sp.]